MGEGDSTILEIARRLDAAQSLDAVCNLSYRRHGSTVTVPRSPLIHDLDTLPWRDNTPEHKYFIEDDELIVNYPVPDGSFFGHLSDAYIARLSI